MTDFNYAALSATGMSPIGLVVRLYETIIGDLGRAITAVKSGEIEKRTFELQHALAVIGQLQTCLDMQNGGEPAKSLDRFYSLATARILKAQIAQSASLLEDIISDFLLMRDTWMEVEKAESSKVRPATGSSPGEWVG